MSASFIRNLIGQIFNGSPSAAFTRVELVTGASWGSASVVQLPQLITYDNATVVSPITPTVAAGLWVRLTLTSNVAYTLNVPSGLANLPSGALVYLTVRNTIGGAAGAQTFGAGPPAWKAPAWVQPATGNSRSSISMWDGTNLVEMVRSAADVAN